MLSILGIVIVGASVWTFWRLLPRDGNTHWIVTAPILESILPLGLISGFTIGVAMAMSIFMK